MNASLLGRRTLMRGIAGVAATAVAGVIVTPKAEAATVSIKIWDNWLGKYLYLYAQTFYAPYYDASNNLRYKVYTRYYAEGATNGGRYIVSTGRGKLSVVTKWVNVPYIGRFQYVGNIPASQFKKVLVDTQVWVHDQQYNSGSWRALPRTV